MDAATAGGLLLRGGSQQGQGLNPRYHGGGGEEALALKPGQIAAYSLGIAVADAMELAQQGGRPLGHLTTGQR